MTKRVITFAGVPGSSKTPIAYYLSWNLGLPILNNDAMRTEVREELGTFDSQEYTRRRDQRIHTILHSGGSFIYDASVDRSWQQFKEALDQAGYEAYIINLDLSRPFVERLHKAKGYDRFDLDQLFTDHNQFLSQFHQTVNLTINDNQFEDRLQIALEHVRTWLF